MSSEIGVRAYFGLDCDDAEAAEAYIRYNLMPEVEGELGEIIKSWYEPGGYRVYLTVVLDRELESFGEAKDVLREMESVAPEDKWDFERLLLREGQTEL